MKIRDEALIPTWAARPDAFALEPAHVQEKYRKAVEAARVKLKGASDEEPMPKRSRSK